MLGVAAAATAAAVGVSLYGPQTDPETLRAFAERVRPPGFWGPYADPHAPRALGRALAATAAAGTTLFAGLIAALQLLVPGVEPGPPWLPWALLALALGALPLWIPRLR
jgi:hypothetical protein